MIKNSVSKIYYFLSFTWKFPLKCCLNNIETLIYRICQSVILKIELSQVIISKLVSKYLTFKPYQTEKSPIPYRTITSCVIGKQEQCNVSYVQDLFYTFVIVFIGCCVPKQLELRSSVAWRMKIRLGSRVRLHWAQKRLALLIHHVKMPYYITLSTYKNRHKCLGSITMQKNKPGNNYFSAFSMRKQINLWIHWNLKPTIWHVTECPTMYYFGTPSLRLSQR